MEVALPNQHSGCQEAAGVQDHSSSTRLMPQTIPSPMPASTPAVSWGIACVCALNLRWFIPAEDTADGATLWLAAFWCAAAAVTTWFPFARDVIARRWTRADVAVVLLVSGHVLSGVLVLLLGGNRHTAATLLAEWLGIGAVWSIIREIVRIPGFRAAIWQSTLLALTAIAFLGCWQHWIELPSMAHRLGPKFDAIRLARASGGTSSAEQELAREGVPLNEPDFTLFEKRLRDSREPFGFFALANTLGGFLAAGLMLILGSQLCTAGSASAVIVELNADNSKAKAPAEPVVQKHLEQPKTLWSMVLGTAALGVCLLLTKSRTALLSVILVGTLVCFLRAVGTRLRLSLTRRRIGMAAGGLLTAAVFLAVLARSGSWDREVLTEAAKSLSYRVFYWTGTVALIAERPILGGGLGQFRNNYLRVKAPAASEEIADPHNFVLDVWYNGGLLAIAGGLWVVATLMITTGKSFRTETPRPHTDTAEPRLLLAGAAAPWGAFLMSGYWDDRLLIVGLVLLFAALLVIAGWITVSTPSRTACGLAALVLFTHLLGAGGIGYTAVMQFLLLCLAGTFSTVVLEEQTNPMPKPIVWPRFGLFLAITIAVLMLWRPDQRGSIAAADELVTRGASAETIRSAYTRAMDADQWDPTPCSRLAEFEFQQWQAGPSTRNGEDSEMPPRLQAAVIAFGEAIRRDPANGHWFFRRGVMLEAWAQRSKSSQAAKLAVESLEHAVNRYPTNARWQATLSDAAAVAGMADLAAKAAEAAVVQDDVNQRFGHGERILTADVRLRLERRRPAVSPR